MTMNDQSLTSTLDLADDAPILTRELASIAQIAEGDRIIREADPPLTRARGRPAKSESERKRQVTMRLSAEVVEAMRASGAGWQVRADEILRRGSVASSRAIKRTVRAPKKRA